MAPRERRSGALALLERAGLKTGIAVFMAFGAIASAVPDNDPVAFVVGLMVWIAIGVFVWARRRRRRREREHVERSVEAAIASAGDTGSEEPKQAAVAAASATSRATR